MPVDPVLSVVVPMLDEQAVVEELVERVHRVVEILGVPAEIVVVDDGSTDRTGALAHAAGARVVRNPRPTGQLTATLRGFAECRGAWIAVLDGDLQDPPEVLQALWEARGDLDVVYAVKSSRVATWRFRLARQVYGMGLRLAGAELPVAAGSYLLARREVMQQVADRAGSHGNLAVLVGVCRPRWTAVSYAKEGRRDGPSRVGRLGLIREGLSSIALVVRHRRTRARD